VAAGGQYIAGHHAFLVPVPAAHRPPIVMPDDRRQNRHPRQARPGGRFAARWYPSAPIRHSGAPLTDGQQIMTTAQAALAHRPCAACARLADQNGVQSGQPARWLRRRPPRLLRLHGAASVALRGPLGGPAVPSRRATTGSARGCASATEPPGRPGSAAVAPAPPAAGGPGQPRCPKPLARSSSHRAGAVSAFHSGLLTTSSQNLGRRQKRRRTRTS
jgi:hypothetical protein